MIDWEQKAFYIALYDSRAICGIISRNKELSVDILIGAMIISPVRHSAITAFSPVAALSALTFSIAEVAALFGSTVVILLSGKFFDCSNDLFADKRQTKKNKDYISLAPFSRGIVNF